MASGCRASPRFRGRCSPPQSPQDLSLAAVRGAGSSLRGTPRNAAKRFDFLRCPHEDKVARSLCRSTFLLGGQLEQVDAVSFPARRVANCAVAFSRGVQKLGSPECRGRAPFSSGCEFTGCPSRGRLNVASRMTTTRARTSPDGELSSRSGDCQASCVRPFSDESSCATNTFQRHIVRQLSKSARAWNSDPARVSRDRPSRRLPRSLESLRRRDGSSSTTCGSEP